MVFHRLTGISQRETKNNIHTTRGWTTIGSKTGKSGPAGAPESKARKAGGRQSRRERVESSCWTQSHRTRKTCASAPGTTPSTQTRDSAGRRRAGSPHALGGQRGGSGSLQQAAVQSTAHHEFTQFATMSACSSSPDSRS